MGEQQSLLRRFFDPQRNAYVDELLPTTTLKLKGPLKRGFIRAPRGTILGYYRVTGSHYQEAQGTYSLRITRASIFAGSREAMWAIRHSRQGTVDVLHFPVPGQQVILGEPNKPVYTFGPGTVTWGFIGNHAGSIGSAYTMGQTLEGIAS